MHGITFVLPLGSATVSEGSPRQQMSDVETQFADSPNQSRRKTWLQVLLLIIATGVAARWTLFRNIDQPFPDPAYVESVFPREVQLGAGHLDDGAHWAIYGALRMRRDDNIRVVVNEREWRVTASKLSLKRPP